LTTKSSKASSSAVARDASIKLEKIPNVLAVGTPFASKISLARILSSASG
jgi:hypothetical protein